MNFLRGEPLEAAFSRNMLNLKNSKQQQSSRSNQHRSLNGVVIGASFIAVFLGTAFWSIIEYFMGASPSWSEFLGHHLIPSLVTGLIIWVILSALLHRTVTEPLRHLFAHLYRVGSGRLEPISLDTGVAEIQTIVEGVNLLVHRLRATSGAPAYTQAQDRLKRIRNKIRSMADAAGPDSPIFLDLVKELRALEGDVLALGSSGGKSVEGVEQLL